MPRPDGRLIVGATVEEQGFDTAVTAGGVHELLREAYRLLPEVAEMELVEATAGLRPGTPDNLPLVGPGALDGLLLATGHYRNGILLAPLAAERRRLLGDRRRLVAMPSKANAGGGGGAMRIELNGEPRELPRGATLADAVREAGRRGGGRAASPSRSTARSCRAASGSATPLAEGQAVEVLAAIQGGADEPGSWAAASGPRG